MAFLLVIGTRKGLFTATSDDREHWEVSGPHRLDAQEYVDMAGVYAVGVDPHTRRMLVGAESSHFGPSVWFSDDLGTTWHEPDHAPIAFPDDVDAAFTRVWQFAFGPEPGTVYAGIEPTALFRSTDGGQSFELVRALWDHPHRGDWFPGAGGAAIHTVLPGRVSAEGTDPHAMTVAMSTGGVYQTRDAGATWAPANRGISAVFLPDEYPEYGQCVHKVAVAADGSFYAQNHHGVYRSDDPAASGWASIAAGLPSDFGFAMVAHPHAPATALSFPVISQARHLPPDYRLRVYRTDDSGGTWRSVSKGLPGEPYYSIVLRDGACTDGADVPGFYFGTRAGDVYATTDDSEEWRQVASHLPDVLCVRAIEV
ncbi:WD40/YVTN/BNR-like repeat-containing protein [Salinactinospora qingdaonensis]|uniref:Exo-alpha-sialidase n=1 Tax=Salinactinospora qingdaonensis TaxID=702744 RepID=A0ABP7FFC4_9ACTN